MALRELCLIGAFFTVTAVAANAAPVAVGGPLWAGWYMGAQLGGAYGRDNIHDRNRLDGSTDYKDHFNIDGATAGVFGGYNYRLGQWVFGAELDAELADISGDNPDWPFGDNTNAKIAAQGSLRARLGYVLTRDNFVYATGGLAFAQIKTEYFDGASVDRYSQWCNGWTIGGGFEHAFGSNWVGRIEYRYTEFNHVTDWTRTTDSNYDEINEINTQVIRIGIAYYFQ